MDKSKSQTGVSRRTALGTIAGVAGTVLLGGEVEANSDVRRVGRLNQSVCKWCYSKLTLDELCEASAAMGIKSVELLGENDWATCKKYNLTCAMANGPTSISDGLNNLALHDKFVAESERLLPLVKAAGLPNMIVFSGNRRGMPDAEGLDNCAKGLKRIIPIAEKVGVTVCMELLNSKHDHHDYMCDHTAWGVELCKRVGSDRFKLLYDIYHMQIMEGDVIDTIQKNIQYIGHFHTGGVPGRNEIDETQELHYPRIATAIAETGYKGYFAHEFIPKRKPVESLKQAYEMCLV